MGEKMNKRTIQISELVIVKEDVFPIERIGLPQANIAGGKTVSFLDRDGSMFYIVGGTTVSFSVKLDASVAVKWGILIIVIQRHKHIVEREVRITRNLKLRIQVIIDFMLPIHL